MQTDHRRRFIRDVYKDFMNETLFDEDIIKTVNYV